MYLSASGGGSASTWGAIQVFDLYLLLLVDYKIWCIEGERYVYKRHLNNVNKLKWHIIDVWHGFHQIVIDSAVNEWRKRLKACVHAQGRHFYF